MKQESPDERVVDSEEKSDSSGMSRRTFLAISGCAVAVAATSQVVKVSGASLVLPPEDDTEFANINDISEKYIATSCLNCPGRCAIVVRTVNGKAVKIAGNPLSRVSDGKTCPRSHVGLQVLYDPERVRTPLKRTNPAKGRGVDPGWVSISWEQALEELTGRLIELRNRGEPNGLLLLCGLNSRSSEDVIFRFAEAYGTPNVIPSEILEVGAEKFGRWMADGNYSEIAYDLGRANYVLAFGASLLESETPLSATLREWGKMRREKPTRGKVVVIDPRYSVTAAKADEWIPIQPGTDAALALGIAHVIIREGLYDADFVDNHCSGFNEFEQLVLKDYAPPIVARMTGIDEEEIRRLAREFAQSSPAIAWIGRGAAGWPNGSYTTYAIYCLNALVGSLDIPGGVIYPEPPPYGAMPIVQEDGVAKQGKSKPTIDVRQLADAILSAKPYPIDIAIGFNTNFNMSAPDAKKWDEALKRVPFYVHLAPFPSEMAQYADVLLPTTTYLEEWGYDHNLSGSAEVSFKQPVVKPLYSAKSIGDIIFEIARKAGNGIADSFAGIGNDAEEFVRYRTAALMNWSELVKKGVWLGPTYEYHKYTNIFKTSSKKFEFRSGNFEALVKVRRLDVQGELAYLPHYEPSDFFGSEADYPLALVTYRPVMGIWNGSQNYPWAQEAFLVMHGRGWDNFVEVNSRTARNYGFKDGDMVWVESLFGKLRVRARVFEGIHPRVVAICLGQGHYAYGRWQKGIGVNPNDIIGVGYDRISGQSAFFNTRVRIYKA